MPEWVATVSVRQHDLRDGQIGGLTAELPGYVVLYRSMADGTLTGTFRVQAPEAKIADLAARRETRDAWASVFGYPPQVLLVSVERASLNGSHG